MRKLPGKDTLKRLYIDEKKTGQQIADTYGVRLSSFYIMASRCGLRKVKGTRRCSKDPIPPVDLLIRIIKSNLSLSDVAQMFGVSPWRFRRWCSINGVTITRRKEREDIPRPLLVFLVEKLGMSFAEVAKLLVAEYEWVYRQAKTLEVQRNRTPVFPGDLRVVGRHGINKYNICKMFGVKDDVARKWCESKDYLEGLAERREEQSRKKPGRPKMCQE